MARTSSMVPYGYVATKEGLRGSLLVYDPFEDFTSVDLELVISTARKRNFTKVVLYPLHEETVRRMTNGQISPFYKREQMLEELLHNIHHEMPVTIDTWEGKRKKYTPIDTALRYLTEKYPAPFFIYLSDEYVNLFASYDTFEEWIKKIRLLVVPRSSVQTHPRLLQYQHRWDSALPNDQHN